MTERMIKFRLKFKTAMYVSANEDPDILEATFRDPYLFVSTNDVAISKSKRRRRYLGS